MKVVMEVKEQYELRLGTTTSNAITTNNYTNTTTRHDGGRADAYNGGTC